MNFGPNNFPADWTGPNLPNNGQQPEFYEDPVYTEDNRYLEKKVDLLQNVLTGEDSEALEAFIRSKLEGKVSTELSETSQIYNLPYRPDEWDTAGVIKKVYDIAREHILKTYAVIGQLEPKSFTLLRTEDVQTYKEEYGVYNKNGEILYTAAVTASTPEDYWCGETRYTQNGEGLQPRRTDMLVHRNESLNDWEILEVIRGTRLDLLIVLREHARRTSYDYPIDQLDENSISF